MKIVKINKTSILSIIYFISALIYYFSGRAFDASNFLIGKFIISEGFIDDRSFVTSVIMYPFILLGKTWGFIIYLCISTYLLNYFTSEAIRLAPKRYKYIYYFPYLPWFALPVLIPGKESIVFFIIYYLISRTGLRPISEISVIRNHLTLKDMFIFSLLVIIACLIRPNVILMTPLISCYLIITNGQRSIYDYSIVKAFSMQSKNMLMVIVYFILILSAAVAGWDYLSESLYGIYKLASYDAYGNTSHTSFIYSQVINKANIPFYAITSSLFGVPISGHALNNMRASTLGIFSVLPTYIVYFGLTNMIALRMKRLRFELIFIFYVLSVTLAFIASWFASAAFLANAGTASRYLLIYAQVLLLTYIPIKNYFVRLSESKF